VEQLPCQKALDRVIAYLRGSGIKPGVNECRTALELVDHALQQAPDGDYLKLVMELLPQYFELPQPKLALEAGPELLRGSMGYE
jgi:hypothetical protein